jgi:hypothetical protein
MAERTDWTSGRTPPRRYAERRAPSPSIIPISPAGAFALLFTALSVIRPASAQSPEDAARPLSPPEGLSATDTRNDAGGSLTVRWRLSPGDTLGGAPPPDYRVERASAPDGPFQAAGDVSAGTNEFIDGPALIDGAAYFYRVVARRGGEEIASPAVGPAVPAAQWFHTGRFNTLVAVIVLSTLIIYFIQHARRGRAIFIRKITGLDAVDEAVGRATEMGRKILFVPGTQDMDNVQTLAGIAILGRVARLTAKYGTRLDVPVSRSLVMVACRETLREAYLAAGRPDRYGEGMVSYVTDDQFGYAAALDGMMVRERPATIFYQGTFYAESLLLAATGNSIGAVQIAGTAEPSQLPFFVATCDYTLIGEELFAAGAYLSREPRQLGSLKGQDLGKAIILALLLVGIIAQTVGLFDFAALFEVQ